ncbi:MAG: sugar phosphate isomerase/epimerase [Lachnospiraceae bacterium]|nr:sugar phosphate isomerase/epimerase [Lachnospiraceae bacterium]
MAKEYKISGFADEISDSLEKQIEGLNSLGINYIEIRGVDGNNIIFHEQETVERIKHRLDAAGIKVSSIGSPLGKIGIDERFEKHFEDFKRAVEVAHYMNSRYIRMFSFYVPQKESLENEGKWEEIKKEVFNRIGRFVDYANNNDIILLHENEKGIFGEKAPECLELMKNFYGNHFKAIFDFANFVQAGQNTLEAYKLLKDYIVYIHVKDARMTDGKVMPAGYGDGHVKEILSDLFENGFDGYLSLEPHLFDFSGFGLLENGNKLNKLDMGVMSGFDSFSLAYDALKKLLLN